MWYMGTARSDTTKSPLIRTVYSIFFLLLAMKIEELNASVSKRCYCTIKIEISLQPSIKYSNILMLKALLMPASSVSKSLLSFVCFVKIKMHTCQNNVL